MKKIIFVVRKFNDVDNMLPLIDKFVLEGHSVRVMSFKPEILKNFLVNFLNGRHGIFIEYPIIHKSGFRVGILYFLSKFLRLIMEKYEKFFTMKYIRFFTMKVEMVLVSVVDRKKNIGDLIIRPINSLPSVNNILNPQTDDILKLAHTCYYGNCLVIPYKIYKHFYFTH